MSNSELSKYWGTLTDAYKVGKRDGQWLAYDNVLFLINSLDTEGMSGKKVRSAIYQATMDMRPDA